MFGSEFVLLYPLVPLLADDNGITPAQFATLLAIWSIAVLVLEVPSGVWADRVSRRLLLIIGPLLGASGYALWIIAPSYPAFAVGYVLIGAHAALASGALEALVYEELDRLGAANRYARVMGRGRALEIIAVMVAMGTAAPVFALWGYPGLGAASVAVYVLCALVAAVLPEHRSGDPAHGEEGLRAYVAVLREGAAEVRRDRRVLAAVLLVPAVGSIWGSLEEYIPYLAAEGGATEAGVALLFLLIYAGASGGGLLAGRAEAMPLRWLALMLGGAGLALAAGALIGLAGFVLIAIAFAGFQMATVVADARLQSAVTGPARATVTSLAGFGYEVLSVGVYLIYGAGTAVTGHSALFVLLAVPYLVIAVLISRLSRRGHGH